MPLVEIEGAHAANLKTINEAVAAGLTDRETANMLIQQSTLEMRRAKDEMSGMATVADALEDGLTSAFMSALDGAQSFEDGIREMARDVIRQLYRVLVVQQMVNAAMGAFGYSPVPSRRVYANRCWRSSAPIWDTLHDGGDRTGVVYTQHIRPFAQPRTNKPCALWR